MTAKQMKYFLICYTIFVVLQIVIIVWIGLTTKKSNIKTELEIEKMFIYEPIIHIDKNGKHPTPGTVISVDDYKKGKYRPNPIIASKIGVSPTLLKKQVISYLKNLKKYYK